MNCNDVRKYFYAFLDDELDVEKNIELLAHVDMCCECGQRMEKERLLQNRVKETVCEVKAPDYLVEAVLKGAEERPSFFVLFIENLLSGRRWVPVAGIVAAMIMIVSLFVVPGSSKKDDVLFLAESKYHSYMMQQLALDIRSQDHATVVEYLQDQTNSKLVLPEIGDDAKLVGAALSEIDGVKVSQVFYLRGETPVSFMIICDPYSGSGDNKNIDFSGMKEIFVDEKIVYSGEGYCGHCKIMGWEDAGSQYVVVSMLNSDEILKMLNKT
jgi:hypothetical protein